MELSQVLEATLSADKAQLGQAQAFLEEAARDNLPLLLLGLSNELADVGKPATVRMASGLQLKNHLTSKDETIKAQFQQRWLMLPADHRNLIKSNVFRTLGTEATPSSAAQCVAYIASAELPSNAWPELIPALLQNVTVQTSTEPVKEATLEAIGYICEEINPQILRGQANEILTSVVQGMRKEEPSARVRLAATKALLNSLEFTKANFDNHQERNFIMQTVCEATQAESKEVQVASLQVLVRVMTLYYAHMQTYMGPALFGISMEAMKSSEDEIALQGIEFWSTIGEEEMDIAIEVSDAEENQRAPARESYHFAKGALQFLVPILLLRLAQQEEYDDEDDWNPCKAASVCLQCLATCCENDIVQLVIPFVREHIGNSDWRYRDAAVMSFGCILEGPESNFLTPIVSQAMDVLIQRLADPSVVVRDTTAWALGRICEFHPDAVLGQPCLLNLLQGLTTGLEAEPRVAANCAWAFTSLAEAAYLKADIAEGETEPATYPLSSMFPAIIEKLLAATDRSDSNTGNLRSASYEAIMELIKNSPRDCYEVIQKTTLIILGRINQLLQLAPNVSSSNQSQFNDIQSLLCASLQSVLRRVTPADAAQLGDSVFQALVAMLQTSTTGGVQEDALMALGSLIELLGEGFMKYFSVFQPFLLTGLGARAEHYQVCFAAVGLVGDLCRSIGFNAIAPIADDLMSALMATLQDADLHRSIKPQVLSVFGDVALAVGPKFVKYVEPVMIVMAQASSFEVDRSDMDMVDYLNELREGILEGYTGIIQGLSAESENGKTGTEVSAVSSHVPGMVTFIEVCGSDPERTDAAIAVACGLLGDLCRVFGKSMTALVNKQSILSMLQEGRHSKVTKTRTLASWASKELRQIKQ